MNQEYIKKAKTAIKNGEKVINPSCIILMGFPGTGKSYTSHYLNEKYNYTILSGENITHAIFGTEKCTGEQYKQAYKILNFLAKELIDSGYRIIIDGTNLKKEFRTNIYNSMNNDVKVFGIYLYTSDEIALNRANSRGINVNNPTNILSSCSKETFEGFKKQLELPNEDENFFMIESNENLLNTLDIVIKENEIN
ncbi:MAG: AAA family ATPase [Candidatus Gracilibacteria bacterium]|nr:AAA family ATPase [Candidatus Gracilibacteria bacterium]MDD2909177.1 AAA family ATPase [Candidatus Gracilibacteria bacterium]